MLHSEIDNSMRICRKTRSKVAEIVIFGPFSHNFSLKRKYLEKDKKQKFEILTQITWPYIGTFVFTSPGLKPSQFFARVSWILVLIFLIFQLWQPVEPQPVAGSQISWYFLILLSFIFQKRCSRSILLKNWHHQSPKGKTTAFPKIPPILRGPKIQLSKNHT